jgi:hypothetical protein
VPTPRCAARVISPRSRSRPSRLRRANSSNVYVFNSAGLNNASLARTGQANFNSLASRTSSFSAQDDFLTYMNNITDQAGQLTNARFLRDQLAEPSGWNLSALKKPMQIQYESPGNTNAPTIRAISPIGRASWTASIS